MQGLDLIYALRWSWWKAGRITVRNWKLYRLDRISPCTRIIRRIRCCAHEGFFCFLLSKILNMFEIVLLSVGFALRDGSTTKKFTQAVHIPWYKSNGLFRKICSGLVQQISFLRFSKALFTFFTIKQLFSHYICIILKIPKLNYIFNSQQSEARVYSCTC